MSDSSDSSSDEEARSALAEVLGIVSGERLLLGNVGTQRSSLQIASQSQKPPRITPYPLPQNGLY